MSYVKLSDLRIPGEYHQGEQRWAVEKLASMMDPRRAGAVEAAESKRKAIAATIVVSRRSDGDLYIVDGVQRVAALRAAGVTHIPEDKLEIVECEPPDEARLFAKINRIRPSARDDER